MHRIKLRLQRIESRRTDDRIAADADASGLTVTRAGDLPNGLIGERTRSRDDAHFAGFVDVARHDAYLTFIRGNDAGTVRAN